MSSSLIAAVTPPPFPSNTKGSSRRRQLISFLRICKRIDQVASIHAKIIRTGHEEDPFVVFELLRVCSRLNSIGYACKVFQFVGNPNVYLYNALIDGFVSSGFHLDGIQLYYQMIHESVLPDNYVISSVLKACGAQMALKKCREIHSQVLKLGLRSNRSVRMKLMEAYGKCGELTDARKVFDEMSDKDPVASTIMITSYSEHGFIQEAQNAFDEVQIKDYVCWTAMIDGLVRNEKMNKALRLFRKMQMENVRPSEVTIVCVLTACSHLGALELGKWVHSFIKKQKIELNNFVCNALISMYSRCGDIEEAIRVFKETRDRDVITYNSIISGLAMHGMSVEAIEMFRETVNKGLRPNQVTFVAVLSACSHGGLLEIGFEIFYSMERVFGIEPQIEHYGCIVDLLGRVGRVEEAYSFMENMKMEPDHIMLDALLSACKIHGNVELAEIIAGRLLESEITDSATYVLLSNVYASSGKWEEAVRIRAKMKEYGIEKEPGCSSIEVNNEIHEFLVGDMRHPQNDAVYEKLQELNQRLKLEGYEPETRVVLQDIADSDKQWALLIHSERLAISYGLISTKPNATIRVVKNLRVCDDCHTMIKLVSKMTRRKIVVRDRKRFHHFENGVCSCGDYW